MRWKAKGEREREGTKKKRLGRGRGRRCLSLFDLICSLLFLSPQGNRLDAGGLKSNSKRTAGMLSDRQTSLTRRQREVKSSVGTGRTSELSLSNAGEQRERRFVSPPLSGCEAARNVKTRQSLLFVLHLLKTRGR